MEGPFYVYNLLMCLIRCVYFFIKHFGMSLSDIFHLESKELFERTFSYHLVKEAVSLLVDLEEFSPNSLKSVLIFSIFNHPRSLMFYCYYLFSVFY